VHIYRVVYTDVKFSDFSLEATVVRTRECTYVAATNVEEVDISRGSGKVYEDLNIILIATAHQRRG